MTFAESGIKLLLCDAPEGLGALDNCLEESDFFFFLLSRNRFLRNKVCYRLVQKPAGRNSQWKRRQWMQTLGDSEANPNQQSGHTCLGRKWGYLPKPLCWLDFPCPEVFNGLKTEPSDFTETTVLGSEIKADSLHPLFFTTKKKKRNLINFFHLAVLRIQLLDLEDRTDWMESCCSYIF